MGCFDVYCSICGGSSSSDSCIETCPKELIENIRSLIKWQDNVILLLADDYVSGVMNEINCNSTFQLVKNSKEQINLDFRNNKYFRKGIFVHKDCYDFVKSKLGIELKYSDFPDTIKKSREMFTFDVDYGKISNYTKGQYFDYKSLIKDKNIFLITSPLEKSSNGTKKQRHIVSVLNKLKIRKGRKSPLCSATWYKNGTIKIGNNGHLWGVSKRKWIEITDYYHFQGTNKFKPSKTTDMLIEKLLKLPQKGESSNNTILTKLDINKRGTTITITIEVIGIKPIPMLEKIF